VNDRHRVLVGPALPRAGLDPLREYFEVIGGESTPEREDLLLRAVGASAIVADPHIPVDDELLRVAGPDLKVVANYAVGYDNIDLDACRKRGVVVTNTPDVLTNATAELTVALILAAARRLGEGERMLRGGRWPGWHPSQLLGRELGDSIIGIIGLGRIGSRVAELLTGFGAELLCSSRTPRPELERRLGVERVELGELVARADVITLHVPASAETHHLVDADLFAQFKRGSILVNTARGALVDTAALVTALRTGQLAAAGLDVYENEPDVPADLVQLENVVLAPHIGSATSNARNGMARLVAENVIAVLDGRGPVTPVMARAAEGGRS
jgi:glyoxylate reductase